MLRKSYTKTGNICRVTFKLPAEANAQTAALCGEFNGWSSTANPMKKLKDGSFSVTVSLEPNQSYRFRYWLDDERWENDWQADSYAANEFGSDDSLVDV